MWNWIIWLLSKHRELLPANTYKNTIHLCDTYQAHLPSSHRRIHSMPGVSAYRRLPSEWWWHFCQVGKLMGTYVLLVQEIELIQMTERPLSITVTSRYYKYPQEVTSVSCGLLRGWLHHPPTEKLWMNRDYDFPEYNGSRLLRNVGTYLPKSPKMETACSPKLRSVIRNCRYFYGNVTNTVQNCMARNSAKEASVRTHN